MQCNRYQSLVSVLERAYYLLINTIEKERETLFYSKSE